MTCHVLHRRRLASASHKERCQAYRYCSSVHRDVAFFYARLFRSGLFGGESGGCSPWQTELTMNSNDFQNLYGAESWEFGDARLAVLPLPSCRSCRVACRHSCTVMVEARTASRRFQIPYILRRIDCRGYQTPRRS